MNGTTTGAARIARPRPGPRPSGAVRFARRTAFQRAVRDAVNAHFRARGIAPHGDWRLRMKAVVLVTWLVASYLALLLAARAWWQAGMLSLSLGFACTAVGFNIHHDANHGAFARTYRANRLLGLVLDLLGGSSYVWRWRHNHFHHNFTNLAGHDADINGAPLVRMSAAQRRRWFHRFQHVYCWFAYTLFPVRWWLWDDYHDLTGGRIEGHAFPRPRGWEVAAVAAGKLAFWTWALIVPALLHPLPRVIACFLIASTVLGICLALSAQLSHVVAEVSFPDETDVEWAAHQIRTCSGFSHGSWLANAFWGGLNFQVEHHLFPRVSHVHYPAIAPVVRATCERFGLVYLEHRTLFQALRSHAVMMKRAGLA